MLEKMKKATIYKCRAAEMRDAVNMYFVNVPNAARIHETPKRAEVFTKAGRLLAVFLLAD